MGSFNISIPSIDRPIGDLLSRVPRPFREQAEKGFVILADVPQQHYAEILRATVIALESRRSSLEELGKDLKLPKNDLSVLFAAAMLSVPIVGQGSTSDEFITAAVRAHIIPEGLVEKLRPFFATVIAERMQITRAIRRAALPTQVLPNLSSVEVAVDLRMLFEKEAVAEGIAVAVLHVETDGAGEEIWFQASKDQLEQMKSDIEEAIKRMEAAEAWGRREPRA